MFINLPSVRLSAVVGEWEAMIRSFAAGALILMAMGATAQAELFGSAPSYGGPSQTVAVCYFSNLGSSAVSFSSTRIYKEFGVTVSVPINNCSTLGSQASCRYVANIANSVAHWCRADVSSKSNLRGRIEIRDSSNTILTTEAMR